MITYADVQRVYHNESKSPTLSEIPEDFYDQIPVLLSEVGKEHEQHITKFMREIHTKRRNKIMLHALRICDKASPPVNITPKENEFYAAAVDLMQKHSKNTLHLNLEKRPKKLEDVQESLVKVRILKPMPSIVGSDLRNYGPFREDQVLELPETNAIILISKQFAEKLEETRPSAQEE